MSDKKLITFRNHFHQPQLVQKLPKAINQEQIL